MNHSNLNQLNHSYGLETSVRATPATEILTRQVERESNARTYCRRLPLVLASAQGVHVTDINGRTYIDGLAGAGTLALGHNHPRVIEALRETLDSGLPLHTLDFATPVKDTFVEELYSSLPQSLTTASQKWKVQFCSPSGADAVEAAIKIAKTSTGRSQVIAFQGAYHGMTQGALALTGSVAAKEALGGLVPDVHFMPFPYPYRCPFGIGDKEGDIAGAFFERTLHDPENGIGKPAAVILEVVQGEGGVIPAPASWLRTIRKVTRDLGIPLIVDEVQAGLGRTGHMFAFEQAGIEPDVIILSKALGGSLPLAVTLYREDLDQWLPGAHAGTFRGNQMAMAAGQVTLEMVRKADFLANVKKVGDGLATAFQHAQESLPVLGDVRHRGLMIGLEIVCPEQKADTLGAYPAWPELALEIQRAALQRGLIVELGGRHGSVVRLLPPLILTQAVASQIEDRLLSAIQSAWCRLRADKK